MLEAEVRIVEPGNRDLLMLIGKLDAELLERYPADEIFGVDFTDPKVSEAVFIVAYVSNQPVGCGGIRPLAGQSTELKRFFVDKPYRQHGIAGRMLDFLEKRAVELKFDTIKLEAGTEQPEAVRFYKKHGYYEIDKFGMYVDCGSSLCFEKKVG